MGIDEVRARVLALEDAAAFAPPSAAPPPAPGAFDALLAGAAAPEPEPELATGESLPFEEVLAGPQPEAGGSAGAGGLGAGGLGAFGTLGGLGGLWLEPLVYGAPAMPYGPAPGGGGQAVLAAAESQVGQSEQPPGSNDGPAIAAYRAAVPGSQPGDPWCAEFASWAAAQAGEPLGDGGEGFRSVSDLTAWAAASGRLLPPTATPQPGDLILFGDRHVGVVAGVEPNGTIDTVEGNYANAVSRVQRSPSEASGYVRL